VVFSAWDNIIDLLRNAILFSSHMHNTVDTRREFDDMLPGGRILCMLWRERAYSVR